MGGQQKSPRLSTQARVVGFKAQPDLAYEFPNRTGPNTQICRTGLNPDLYFQTFYLPSMGYQFL